MARSVYCQHRLAPDAGRMILLDGTEHAKMKSMGMTFHEARHLLARTGFGGTPDEIRRFTTLDREAAVEKILVGTTQRAGTPPPAAATTPPPQPQQMRSMAEVERKAFREARREEALALKGWWYQELLTTPSPLTERMTLFWHNHFTSSFHKVKWPAFLYRQNALLRQHALGSFRDLLHAIAKDPAMILYLDTQTNNKDHPNENFARELLELFTLGEGHYSEQDIKAAARAFTGWKVDRHTAAFRFVVHQHDHGIKRVLGRTGAFRGEDILALVLDQPQVTVHLTEKLWREFISETPDPREVERIAGVFRHSGYRITPWLNALFTSPHFWAPENRGVLTKSPVDLTVGTIRLFNLPIKDATILARYGRRLGQDLFDPPNVKGWPGGTRWITTTTLLGRWQLLQRGFRGHEMGGHLDHGANAMDQTRGPTWVTEEPVDVLQSVLLPIPPVNPIPEGEERWKVVQQIVLDPVYQLK